MGGQYLRTTQRANYILEYSTRGCKLLLPIIGRKGGHSGVQVFRRSGVPEMSTDRCEWARTEPNLTYHDEEWGVPVHDDRLLFEFLILEGAQAGLSWETILKKREGYRQAFDHFNPESIAGYNDAKLAELLQNPGIVRNRLKVA